MKWWEKRGVYHLFSKNYSLFHDGGLYHIETGTWKAGLCTHLLDTWTLDSWTLEDWTLT